MLGRGFYMTSPPYFSARGNRHGYAARNCMFFVSENYENSQKSGRLLEQYGTENLLFRAALHAKKQCMLGLLVSFAITVKIGFSHGSEIKFLY